MIILNKLYNYFKSNIDINYSQELTRRYILFNFFLLFSTVFCLIYGFISFFYPDTFLAVLLLTNALMLFLNYVYLKQTKNYNYSSKAVLILLSILFFYLLSSSKNNTLYFYWLVIYPVISLFFFGRNLGSKFSLSFFGIVIIYFILGIESEFLTKYTFNDQINFCGLYLGIYLFLMVYKFIGSRVANKSRKEIFEIQKQLKEKNDFISKLSFQIRTPLNNIVGILNIKEQTKNKDLIHEIEMSVNNLLTIVNLIPEFSKTKIKMLKSQNVSFNVKHAIKNSTLLFSNESYKGLRFNTAYSSNIPNELFGNMLIFRQVFVSIIDFFYKNLSGKSIKLDIIVTDKEKVQGDLLFKIKCNLSLPVLKEYEDKDSFTNVSKINIPDLQSINEIIKSLDGKLNIYSESNATVFLFNIPFEILEEKDQKDLEEPDITDSIEIVRHKIPLENANVLLVEDDPVNQKIMLLSLKKFVKNVDVAEHGKEGLMKFGTTKYDIILMDIRMPVMDGFVATRKIRETESGTGSRIPIIAVTANALSGDREKCIEAGMDDYLSKPFQVQELINLMRSNLE